VEWLLAGNSDIFAAKSFDVALERLKRWKTVKAGVL